MIEIRDGRGASPVRSIRIWVSADISCLVDIRGVTHVPAAFDAAVRYRATQMGLIPE